MLGRFKWSTCFYNWAQELSKPWIKPSVPSVVYVFGPKAEKTCTEYAHVWVSPQVTEGSHAAFKSCWNDLIYRKTTFPIILCSRMKHTDRGAPKVHPSLFIILHLCNKMHPVFVCKCKIERNMKLPNTFILFWPNALCSLFHQCVFWTHGYNPAGLEGSISVYLCSCRSISEVNIEHELNLNWISKQESELPIK